MYCLFQVNYLNYLLKISYVILVKLERCLCSRMIQIIHFVTVWVTAVSFIFYLSVSLSRFCGLYLATLGRILIKLGGSVGS